MNRSKRRAGFSLIELLIVLAIVAILASLTIPSYTNYVYKSRRADAITELLRLQLAQEQWRAGHGDYSDDLAALGWASPVFAEGRYRLRFEADASGHWRAVAQPQGPQRGDPCAALAVDAEGPVYGGRYGGRACWNR